MRAKFFIAILAIAAFGFTATAQDDLKIGYTNADYLLSLLPEAKQIESELKAYALNATFSSCKVGK